MAYNSILKIYKGLGNTAKIEVYHGKQAFKGDRIKADTYRVVFSQDFEGGFIYHVTCFESFEEAEKHISEYPFFEAV